ncbi:MAG: hypothetical protein II829_01635 [Bacteroidales bacterium]|nr:hypothetical protein [Bacteroidales bacterium]
MKKLTMIAVATIALAFASCGNQGSNNTTTPTPAAKSEEAPAKVAYEQITVEKYGFTFDILKGMRRTDDPSNDNGGVWTLVPENSDDFAIDATVQAGVYESIFGPYDDERIQREFDEEIPAEAEKKLDLEKKEYTYSVAGEISEFHRVIFKDNQQINIMVAYTEKWAPKLGGEVRDHILNSAKFN